MSGHESDELNLEKKHHRAKKTTEGGRCLAPYGPYAQQSCSYRFQAYKQALDEESDVYNGDKYTSIKRKFTMERQRKAKKGEPRWEKVEVKPPKKGEWDVAADNTNFQRSCNRPYWYEAHHIIPHSQLKTAVGKVGEGKPNAGKLKLAVRKGLMDESYNLNHKKNMIILPMAELVAKALELPMHLSTVSHRDHPRYSKYVDGKLTNIFSGVKEAAGSGHKKKIEYKPARKKLENLSKKLRGEIKALGKLWGKEKKVSLENINPASAAAKLPKAKLKSI